MVEVGLFGELEVVHGGVAVLGARVGITGRDTARTQAAAAAIARESGNPCVEAFTADMSAQAEVRRLAAAVLDAYPRLDVLVNNVGGFWGTRHVTADGLERTFAVDHLAGFLLAKVMITASRPFLKTPAQGAATSIYLSGRRHKRLAVLRPGRARRGAD